MELNAGSCIYTGICFFRICTNSFLPHPFRKKAVCLISLGNGQLRPLIKKPCPSGTQLSCFLFAPADTFDVHRQIARFHLWHLFVQGAFDPFDDVLRHLI